MDEKYLAGENKSEKFISTVNSPRVVVDNESCPNATVIMVDRADKHDTLLEVVQVLAELNLIITKAYISFIEGCFMDVFNVVDRNGNKIRDETTLNEIYGYVHESLGSAGLKPSLGYTSIELTGMDRLSLLSEICVVLTSLLCNVVNAKIWTHNTRAAAVMQVTDKETGLAIADHDRLSRIKELLYNVLIGNDTTIRADATFSMGCINGERRLHQMMLSNADYERFDRGGRNKQHKPSIAIFDWSSKNYSVVTIMCKDRPKLLFDVVCTLTDMQYVVFHGSIDTKGEEAFQEYHIRHIDGSLIDSQVERLRLVQCLEAAIERRVSEGLRLEICTSDQVGLLAALTPVLRENAVRIAQAEVDTTEGGKCTFYILDASGGSVDSRTLDGIQEALGESILLSERSS